MLFDFNLPYFKRPYCKSSYFKVFYFKFFHSKLTKCLAFMKLIVLKCIAMGILALGLTGCGETEGDLLGNNSGTIIDGSGAPEPDIAGTVTGVVSGFGSVFIDGVRYATDNAEVYIDGELKSEADLNLGDFITVFTLTEDDDGEIAAQTIYAESAVRGAITHIDTSVGELTVLGQKVTINDETFYGESTVTIDAFGVGDIIDIRGPSNNSGSVVATRIYPSDNRQASLRGVVNALNIAESTFLMSGIEVHYGAASELPDALSDSLPVVIKGTFDSVLQRFMAQSIRQRNDAVSHFEGINTSIKVRTEGVVGDIIADADSATLGAIGSLILDGQKIHITEQTLLINSDAAPATFAELTDGQYLIVLGMTDGQGQIIAEKVIVKALKRKWVQTTLNGIITDITQATPSSVKRAATGEIIIEGTTVLINEHTRFVALDASFMKKRINFEDLGVGDIAVVRGTREYEAANDSFSAQGIEGLSDSEWVQLLDSKEQGTAAQLSGFTKSLQKGSYQKSADPDLTEGPITARIIELKRVNTLKEKGPIKEGPVQPSPIKSTPVKEGRGGM